MADHKKTEQKPPLKEHKEGPKHTHDEQVRKQDRSDTVTNTRPPPPPEKKKG